MSCFLLVLQRMNSVKYNKRIALCMACFIFNQYRTIYKKCRKKSYVRIGGRGFKNLRTLTWGSGVNNCQNHPYVINEWSLCGRCQRIIVINYANNSSLENQQRFADSICWPHVNWKDDHYVCLQTSEHEANSGLAAPGPRWTDRAGIINIS